MNKDKLGKALAAGAGAAAAAAVAATTVAATKKMRRQQEEEIENAVQNRDYGDKQVYFVGGGIASLAGAAYLVRDANFKGKNIHILEGMDILGGSNDGIGTPEKGFVCRGGRMLNEETYENFWDLFSSIPSLDNPDRDVTTEILNFDHAHPTHARARLIDKDGKILDVYSMGFNNEDRMAMARLLATPEKDLDNLTIEDWFNPVSYTHLDVYKRQAEICPHTSDGGGNTAFAREVMLNDTKVCCSAAHVDDNSIVETAQIGGAADRIGRPAGNGEDGIPSCKVHGHKGPVVLAQKNIGVFRCV